MFDVLFTLYLSFYNVSIVDLLTLIFSSSTVFTLFTIHGVLKPSERGLYLSHYKHFDYTNIPFYFN